MIGNYAWLLGLNLNKQSTSEVPWIFENGANIDLLKYIHTPMATSSVVTKGVDVKKRKLEDDAQDKTSKAKRGGGGGGGKSRGKGGGKGKGKGKKMQTEGIENNEKENEKDTEDEEGKSAKNKDKEKKTPSQIKWESVIGGRVAEVQRCNATAASNQETALLKSADTSGPASSAGDDVVFAGPVDDDSGNSDSRPSLWLDDVYLAAKKVLLFEFNQSMHSTATLLDSLVLPKNINKSMVGRVLAIFFSMALEFAWNRRIVLQGKEFKTWSTVRPTLQELIHKAYKDMKSGGGGGCSAAGDVGASASSSSTTQSAALSRLMAAVSSSSDAEAIASEPTAAETQGEARSGSID